MANMNQNIDKNKRIEVVWKPIPNSSQALALDSRAHHTLYTGARGPGKTDCQLMRFRRNVGVGYGSFWRGVIFDTEYKHLDDVINKSKRWFYLFKDGGRYIGGAQNKWVWPTGEELLFRTGSTAEDYWGYHGQEFPFIGFNELTKQPTAEFYDMMQSCNRSSFTPGKDSPDRSDPLPPIPLETFSTTNPYGIGHGWVKRRFIDPAPYGKIVKTKIDSVDPATKQPIEVEIKQVSIFGSYVENIYLDPKYIATLINEKDENRRKAWLMGDWDIVAGGAFDDVWDRPRQVVPRFVPPKSWRIDRSFDWGSSHPFSVGWWAEANGEETTLLDGSKWCPPKGSLIRVYEWYGSDSIGENKGVKLSAKVIAEGIRDIEIALMQEGWFLRQPLPGPADNQIDDVRESDVDTIKKKMEDIGIKWTPSDKSPGSRRNGMQLIRDRLEAASNNDGPGLYFMECCRVAIATLPTLPRDKKILDDVDTQAEDHAYDEIRYRVLAADNRAAQKIKFKRPT